MQIKKDFLVYVRQNEIGIISREIITARTILYTDGFNPCVAVVLWNDKWVALSHLHGTRAGTFQISYEALLRKMRRGNDNSIIYATLVYAENYDITGDDNRDAIRKWLGDHNVKIDNELTCKEKNSVAVSREGFGDPEIETEVDIMRPERNITNYIVLPEHKNHPIFCLVTGMYTLENCDVEKFKSFGLTSFLR
jgi:hypothetical protein